MNEYYIKIQGKANIATPLNIGHNFKVVCDTSIVRENKEDLENGSFAITWKAVPVTVEVTKDNGEVVKAKDPRRNSQKIRNYLFKVYSEEGIVEDFDMVYDAFTLEVMLMTRQLLAEAIKRINK